MNVDAIATQWLEADRQHARDANERAALAQSLALRVTIVELWHQGERAGDLLSAFAQLGRALALDGISTATALACARCFATLMTTDAPTLAAALLEAHTEQLLSLAHERTRARFTAPWTKIAEQVAVLIADLPTDDDEWLADWADRVALAMLRAGVRRCILHTNPPARSALGAALAEVGIDVIDTMALPTQAPRRGLRRWFGR